MTIHSFPEGKALKNILSERRDELSELYDTLNRAYELAHTIEERADALEHEYKSFSATLQLRLWAALRM